VPAHRRLTATKGRGFSANTQSGMGFAWLDAWGSDASHEQDLGQAMSTIDQSRLLQMRSAILTENTALQRAAGRGVDGATPGGPSAQGGEFGKTMVDALKAVDAQQDVASSLSAAYERGDTHDIVKVMVERQRASLGFEATLQVRNKLLSAYRDIMNMPV
jgi:flagellar hook-basal body complex protein FliE